MIRFALVTLLLGASAFAQDDPPTLREQVADHMKVVRARSATPTERSDAMEELLELGPEGQYALVNHLDRELRKRQKKRVEDARDLEQSFWTRALAIGRDKAGGKTATEIAELRRDVMGSPVTKEAISSRKDPAVARLRELLLVRPNDIWDVDEDLYEDFGDLLDTLEDEEWLYGYWFDARAMLAEHQDWERQSKKIEDMPDPLDAEEALLAQFDRHCRFALHMPDQDRDVLEKNDKLFQEIDSKEADGIRDLNDLRVLVGLNALRVDVKLCRACRGHSKDMVDHDFFAHDSPIEGKRTPGQRAALEGTSAGAENIAWGSEEGPGANRQWWYSPGHHRNMMGRHVRIGLGRHNRHWTQCFG